MNISLLEVQLAILGLESVSCDLAVTEYECFGVTVRRNKFEQTLKILRRHQDHIIEEQFDGFVDVE